MKALIDDMHLPYLGAEAPPPTTSRAAVTRAVHLYDSVVVLERAEPMVKYSKSISFMEGQIIW